MIRNDFNFFWSGGCKAKNVVGGRAAKWLIGRVVGVENFNDRCSIQKMVCGK